MIKFTKDPFTHPAHGPLTEERLIRVREWLQSSLAYSEGSDRNYMMADAAKAIDELLARRNVEQEPVATAHRLVNKLTGTVQQWKFTPGAVPASDGDTFLVEVMPLYAAPQLPQPAVAITQHFDTIALDTAKMVMCDVNRRDEFLGGDIQLLSRIQCRIDEACRAAMLQGAEPVSQPYTLRDGWVAVPVEPTEEMNKAGWAAMNEHDAINPTYRAMLAAAPDFREISNSSTKHFRESAETSTKCWCYTCRPVTMTDMRFVVCPECGNKRCPHANDHRNACTGSNEPGQEGSAYPEPQQ